MRFVWRIALCALCACAAARETRPDSLQARAVRTYTPADFPHPAVYLYLSSDGHQLDSDANVANIARFSLAVIHASPATEDYSNRLRQIRALNPNIVLLAYFPGDFMWPLPGARPESIFGNAWTNYLNHDWWLYATDGTPFKYFGNTVDLTRPEVTDWMASFIYDRVLSTGLWDGVFLDDFCESNYWKESTNGQFIDENRDRVADDQATFDPIWKTATDTLAAKLRARMGPDMLMVGNCGYGSKWRTMNGWMREDFPFQGNWSTNMFSSQGGYLVNDVQYHAPQADFVYATSLLPPDDLAPANLRFMRYCMASSLLGNGYFMFDPRQDTVNTSKWWFDEYDAGGLGPGYLGQPQGTWFQQIGDLTTPDLFTNTGFESGLTGWTPYNITGPVVLDPSSKVQGNYSAHVIVNSATAYYSQIYLRQQPSLLTRGYSVTFWARAAQPRHMWVQAQKVASPFTVFTTTQLDLGTTWKRFQVPFPVNSPGLVNVSLQMGSELGDVWLDDVHLQMGASSMYRRNFDRGTVMVNPNMSAVTTTLEHPYYHFWGTQDPAVNNGSQVTQITVGTQDAAILLTQPPQPISAGSPRPRPAALQLSTQRSPARGEARFELRLEEAADVEVRLFSVTGREVATLHRGPLTAGLHIFTWRPDASDGPPAAVGVYFARARAQFASGVASATTRVALLR